MSCKGSNIFFQNRRSFFMTTGPYKEILEDKTSRNAKLFDELKHIKELQADVHTDENLNIVTVAVTNTGALV